MAGLAILPACAPGPASPIARDACLSGADSTLAPLDTVVVALTQVEAERFLSRQLNSTLVRLDCQGLLRPDLATRWTAEDGGKSWVFTLRMAAAGTIRDAWEARRNGGIWPWPAILGVEAVDPVRLRVRLDRPYPDLPIQFDDPGLSVPGGSFGSQFTPLPSAGPVASITYLVPMAGTGPVIKVEQMGAGVDPRDALDLVAAGLTGPADVVITRDAAVVAYARDRPEFTVIPGVWNLTYVLVAGPATGLDRIGDRERQALVRDVVPGEVRLAVGPFWWDSLPCLSPSEASGTPGTPLIAFSRSDPIARALAERLAAIAVTRSRPRAVAVGPSGIDSLATRAPALAIVLPFARRRPLSCAASPHWGSLSTLDPLVDLRSFVILRRGVPSLVLDGDGMVRFTSTANP